MLELYPVCPHVVLFGMLQEAGALHHRKVFPCFGNYMFTPVIDPGEKDVWALRANINKTYAFFTGTYYIESMRTTALNLHPQL